MKKLTEYLQHVVECREMAKSARPEHRRQLEEMAETWQQLADARKQALQKAGQTDDEFRDTTPPQVI